MAPTSAIAVPCDACGAEIEGASIWYGRCWHVAEMSRAVQPARSLD